MKIEFDEESLKRFSAGGSLEKITISIVDDGSKMERRSLPRAHKKPRTKKPPKTKVEIEQEKEKRRKKARDWYLKNAAKVSSKNAKYSARNPEKRAGYAAKRRSRRSQQTTPEESRLAAKRIRQIKCELLVKCSYCGAEIHSKKIQIDHVVPLSKGGRYVAENLVPSCCSCNSSKGSKII
jgi:5-methylcytosine-specific restriction endonuclease McrA